MTQEEINALADRIQALAPQTRDVVLRYLDLLLQVQGTAQDIPERPEIND